MWGFSPNYLDQGLTSWPAEVGSGRASAPILFNWEKVGLRLGAGVHTQDCGGDRGKPLRTADRATSSRRAARVWCWPSASGGVGGGSIEFLHTIFFNEANMSSFHRRRAQ